MLNDRPFLKVFAIQVVYMFAVVFSWSFTYVYFVNAGLSSESIILMKFCTYGSSIALVVLLRRYVTMKSISLGFFGSAVILVLIPYSTDWATLALLGILDGLTFPLFWVPYNTMYFNLGRGRGAAYHAALAFLVPPVLSIVAPIAAGYILDVHGVIWVMWAGALTHFAGGIYYGLQKAAPIKVNLVQALKSAKGIKTLVFIQGFWQAVDWICVPLVTLQFLTTGSEYGGFFSVLAVLGAISTLYFSRVSDRSGNRVDYLYPSIVMTAIATLLSAYTATLINWLIVRSIVSFFVALSNPFTTSIVLDKMKNTADAMQFREIMLNSGRSAGILVIFACQLFFGGYQSAFIPAGVLLFTYPLIVEYKRLYKAKLRKDALLSDETMEFHE
jgi:hypothetical protein